MAVPRANSRRSTDRTCQDRASELVSVCVVVALLFLTVNQSEGEKLGLLRWVARAVGLDVHRELLGIAACMPPPPGAPRIAHGPVCSNHPECSICLDKCLSP